MLPKSKVWTLDLDLNQQNGGKGEKEKKIETIRKIFDNSKEFLLIFGG